MENVLIVWVHAELQLLARSIVKATLLRNFSINEDDITHTGSGFEFLFDDETGGRAAFEFIDDGSSLGIKIKAEYSWEAVALYEMVMSIFNNGGED